LKTARIEIKSLERGMVEHFAALAI